MRDYEIVYIFDPQLAEERVQEKLDRYHELLTSNGGGEVKVVDVWGRRQLAYPIAKQTSGVYVVAQCQAKAEALPEFERVLKLDDELLRYLVVLHEGEPAASMSIATREPKPEGEDDDEED